METCAAGGIPANVPLDRYYGKGVQFTSLREMRNELKTLYKEYRIGKLAKIKQRGDDKSSYVVVGNEYVKLLADWKNLQLVYISTIEVDHGLYQYGFKDEKNKRVPVWLPRTNALKIETALRNFEFDCLDNWAIKAKKLLEVLQ